MTKAALLRLPVDLPVMRQGQQVLAQGQSLAALATLSLDLLNLAVSSLLRGLWKGTWAGMNSMLDKQVSHRPQATQPSVWLSYGGSPSMWGMSDVTWTIGPRPMHLSSC